MMRDISNRLKIMSSIVYMGEKIPFGSDCALMDEAADIIDGMENRIKLAEDEIMSLREQLKALKS